MEKLTLCGLCREEILEVLLEAHWELKHPIEYKKLKSALAEVKEKEHYAKEML